MIGRILITIVFLQFVSSQTFQDDNILNGQLTVVVEDNLGDSSSNAEAGSLDEERWTERTVINIHSVKLGQSQISHTRQWNSELLKTLKKLALKNDFYKLRLHQKNGREPRYVQTFTDACLLYTGGLSETLTVMVDGSPSVAGVPEQTVVSASLAVPTARFCDLADVNGEALRNGHNTTLQLRTPSAATPPDTATFIQKLESMNKEKTENKDNRSFFAKYWMYIVPIVVILVISNGGQEGGGR